MFDCVRGFFNLFRMLQQPNRQNVRPVWPPRHWPPRGKIEDSFSGEGYQPIEPTPTMRQLLADCFAGAFWQKNALAYCFGSFNGYRAIAQTAIFPPDPYCWFAALLLTWEGVDVAILIPWSPGYVPEREAMLIASAHLSAEQVDALAAALLKRLQETQNSPQEIAERQSRWMRRRPSPPLTS